MTDRNLLGLFLLGALTACSSTSKNPGPSHDEMAKKARAFLAKEEGDKIYQGLAALALMPDPAADPIVARLASVTPGDLNYPQDFAAAYWALAVVEAHMRDKTKHHDGAKAWVTFILERQNKEGDWGYGFDMTPKRWIETTMNVPVLEALLAVSESGHLDDAAVRRALDFLKSYQVADGRFLNDKSRPASTEATAAVMSILARCDRNSDATRRGEKALVKVETILAAMKNGEYKGLNDDDRAGHGPASFPYGLYYAALAERRLTGRVTDEKRKKAILDAFAAWQAADGSFGCAKGKTYGTALAVLALEALFSERQ